MPDQVPQIDWDDQAIEFLPVSHRTPRFIKWTQGFTNGGAGWINKNYYNYLYGDNSSEIWDNSISYQLNDKVKNYFGVWISLKDSNLDNNPQESPEFWYQIAPTFIGAQVRAQFNAQKLIMEWALNTWFFTNFKQPTSLEDGTTTGIWYLPTSDIWIQTISVTEITFLSGEDESESSYSSDVDSGNSYSTETTITGTDTTYKFIVWIPTSLSVSLGVSYIEIISKVVNGMCLIGTTFTIELY